MAWTTPKTYVTGEIVTATDLNKGSDNFNYLLTRPGEAKKYTGATGGTISTTSTTFGTVDATEASITATMSGSRALVGFQGHARLGANNQIIHFDFNVDGARYGGSETNGRGLVSTTERISGLAANDVFPVGFTVLVSGLSVGSHTFSLVWRTTAGTATLFAGSNTTSSYPLSFWVQEI